jgi:hypothetical protein
MYINFNYHGSTYKAGLAKQPEGKILVLLNDNELGKQFGSTLPFYVENKSVNFNILNRSHSELYALNSSISKAISEQCKDLLA